MVVEESGIVAAENWVDEVVDEMVVEGSSFGVRERGWPMAWQG